MLFKIYKIVDINEPGTPRYIGCTRMTLKRRMTCHRTNHTVNQELLQFLLNNNADIILLDETDDILVADKMESFFLDLYWGPLFNKQRISNLRGRTTEVCQRIRESTMGNQRARKIDLATTEMLFAKYMNHSFKYDEEFYKYWALQLDVCSRAIKYNIKKQQEQL